MEAVIHSLAAVESANVGRGTTIWQFVVVLKEARIGEHCNVCSHVFIENDVIIGNKVTIKNGVQIWDGLRIGDGAFIGPNVTFTNDRIPRSKQHKDAENTVISEGASIGANATVLSGLHIGRHAMIGAGSVVTHDVGDFQLWYGNPARHVGYVTQSGEILDLKLQCKATGRQFQIVDNEFTAT